MAESLHILLGTSACLQWLCHSGERTVARGPLVLSLVWLVRGNMQITQVLVPIMFLINTYILMPDGH